MAEQVQYHLLSIVNSLRSKRRLPPLHLNFPESIKCRKRALWLADNYPKKPPADYEAGWEEAILSGWTEGHVEDFAAHAFQQLEPKDARMQALMDADEFLAAGVVVRKKGKANEVFICMRFG